MMRTNLKPANTYPFAWLDELVEITLNPAYLQLKALAPKHLEEICGQLPGETREIECSLKTHTFGLNNKADIQTVVAQYYFAVLDLHRQAFQNLNAYIHNPPLAKTGKAIIAALDELKRRISMRYRVYLPEQPEGILPDSSLPTMLYKQLIKLSGDQIGILARAAFQAGLIPANSLRAAFRLLAPHISTDRKAELSAESMRSNSGRAETPDLDIVLGHLSKLTSIIQGYYRRR
jgi:hypothetical protein